MPARQLDFSSVPDGLVQELAELRQEMQVPDGFPPEVVAAAVTAVENPRLPTEDRTDLPMVTIDPPGARDLDQAMYLEREGDDIVVWYAIADVSAFVTAGDPIDSEARERGQTLYAPDRKSPLHPPELSESAASLLPDQVCPAFLWRIVVAPDGQFRDARVQRSLVRSTAQHTYEEVQQQLDGGTASPSLQLLAEVGQLREAVERDRGGVSLPIPEQEIETGNGSWELVFRDVMPVEGWNAQISLLTGIAAAGLMLDGGIGILRTLPPAEQRSLRRLRQTARALRIEWGAAVEYPDFVRSLDPGEPSHAAMLNACTTLFRGAGYTAFSGEAPKNTEHAALATPYAHCTAPLRRLVDRWALEVCAALCAGEPVPEWVTSSLDTLPDLMSASDRRAKSYERAIIDLVEAHRLSGRVGDVFDGVIVDVDDKKGKDGKDGTDGRQRGRVVVGDQAVEANVFGTDLPLGQEVRVRLSRADPAERRVEFELLAS
ncbi:RNB domain-containing ribonuclease [Propionibacteriaceae bacterium Y2011]